MARESYAHNLEGRPSGEWHSSRGTFQALTILYLIDTIKKKTA
jgi:hypothetical protein